MKLCCASFLLLTAAVFAEEEALTPDAYVASIGWLNLDPNAYIDYAGYHSTIERVVSGRLERVRTIEELKTIFYRCHTLWKNAPEGSQDQLQWLDIHCLSLSAIVHRLSVLKTPEAARLLVELYCDKNVRWDGGFASEGVHAILQYGNAALPHLEAHKDRSEAQEIITLIKKGVRSAF